MNKKIIIGIAVLAVAVLALLASSFMEKQTAEAPIIPPMIEEPESLPLSNEGYVYDEKLNFGFNYPDGWGFSVVVDKDFEQCDPALSYETYNCVEFPDRSMKKSIVFRKEIPKDSYLVSVDIDFSAKTGIDSQVTKEEFKSGAILSGLEILKEEIISVNNVEGYDIVAGTSGWTIRQTMFFANDIVYIFKYSSQEEFYLMYEETFNNIINSFNVK